MKSTVTILVILFFATACKTNIPSSTKMVENCVAITEKPLVGTGDFRILSVWVEENYLKMDVEHNAVGNPDVFMSWNGAFMKSLPPKASVQVGFVSDKNDDKANLIKRTVCYDISKLRENTRKQGLVILIEGFDKPISIPAEK